MRCRHSLPSLRSSDAWRGARIHAPEQHFGADLPAAIEAVRSGAIAFELADGRWKIFKVLSESGR